MRNRDQEREIRPHQHDGPKTGQTEDDQWIMTCETCGVKFVAGLEDMDVENIKIVMDVLGQQEGY